MKLMRYFSLSSARPEFRRGPGLDLRLWITDTML